MNGWKNEWKVNTLIPFLDNHRQSEMTAQSYKHVYQLFLLRPKTRRRYAVKKIEILDGEKPGSLIEKELAHYWKERRSRPKCQCKSYKHLSNESGMPVLAGSYGIWYMCTGTHDSMTGSELLFLHNPLRISWPATRQYLYFGKVVVVVWYVIDGKRYGLSMICDRREALRIKYDMWSTESVTD